MILTVQENEDGLFIELPEEILTSMGLEVGDSITWKDNNDGSFILSKTPATSLVLVEAIMTFRMRYVVEVPTEHPDYALDTVIMSDGNLKEFSQLALPENIISHRIIDKKSYLEIFDEDNDYLRGWSDEQKLEFINKD